jgi:hypothetical protein
MKSFPILLVLSAVAVSGCSSVAARLTPPAREIARLEVESPGPADSVARETRYYADENGIVWDDRGKRREPTQ